MESLIFARQKDIDLTSLRIESDRILLTSIDESYANEIFREFTPEIARYMIPKPAGKLEETLSFISVSVDGMRKRRELVLVITTREGKEFLGCCGLHGKEDPRTPHLGIWIKKGAHGNKYGREAIAALASWAARNIESDYLVYPVDRENTASRRIPESLGGIVFEEKKVTTMSGGRLNEVIYRIPRRSFSRASDY